MPPATIEATAPTKTGSTYSPWAVRLHWISALLILIEWPLGKFWMDDDGVASGFDAMTAHIWIGLVVCILTVVRVMHHFFGPQPEKLPMPRWEQVLFTLNHWVLYLALLAASFTGVAMLVGTGMLPMPGSTYKRSAFEDTAAADLHEAPANVLLFMFIMHVVGVAYYQLTHGATLRRMGIPVKK